MTQAAVSHTKYFYFKAVLRFHINFIRILTYCVFIIATAVTKQPDKRMDIGKEAAIEAEVRAARERALVPLDIRVKSFKEMLKEKDVSLTIGFLFRLCIYSKFVVGFSF